MVSQTNKEVPGGLPCLHPLCRRRVGIGKSLNHPVPQFPSVEHVEKWGSNDVMINTLMHTH